MDTAAWLIAIGWKADTAPFRPALQLLEPDEDESYWRLQLILQDKRDESALVPIRLADNGEPYGLWPTAWSAHVHERAAGWLERLRGSLPPERFAAGGDVLAEPLSDAIAWRFLTAESQRLLEAGWQVLLGVVGSRQPEKAAPASEDQLRRRQTQRWRVAVWSRFDHRFRLANLHRRCGSH